MKRLNKTLAVALALFLSAGCLQAQQELSSAGGTATGDGGSMSYTLGQPIAATAEGICIGIQQTITVEETRIDGMETLPIELSVYPNPTVGHITIEVSDNKGLQYTLYSVNGIALQKGTLEQRTQLSLNQLPSGAYLLHVSDTDNRVRCYRIVKR